MALQVNKAFSLKPFSLKVISLYLLKFIKHTKKEPQRGAGAKFREEGIRGLGKLFGGVHRKRKDQFAGCVGNLHVADVACRIVRLNEITANVAQRYLRNRCGDSVANVTREAARIFL